MSSLATVALREAREMVAYIKKLGVEIVNGSTRARKINGEPCEFWFIFKTKTGKFYNFFTGDARYSNYIMIRTCKDENDYTGGMNTLLTDGYDLRFFLKKHGEEIMQ